ncbi:MAG: NAD-dependent aldehyde dehydrogenase, partial [Bacteroidetes bacterium]
MNISERIAGFAGLGHKISQVLEGKAGSPAATRLAELLASERQHNGWFTEENIRHMLASIARQLQKEALEKWTSGYDLSGEPMHNVAVIMAGNIPFA